jgi:hypothetical protein
MKNIYIQFQNIIIVMSRIKLLCDYFTDSNVFHHSCDIGYRFITHLFVT